MNAKLLVDGPGMWAFAQQLVPGKIVRVGRTSDNELRLTDRAVSARHAEFYEVAGTWYVRDVGSSNGTQVNGSKVRDVALHDGDRIKFGKCEVVFQSAHSADASADKTWDETKIELQKDETALRKIIDRAGSESNDSIPSFVGRSKSAQQDVKEVGVDSSPSVNIRLTAGMSSSQNNPLPNAPIPSPTGVVEKLNRDGLNAVETIWVAEQLASIVAELVKLAADDREKALEGILKRLQGALEADNGFVMIAEPTTNRWVIRSWIGNSESWTTYEKDHPVPLTIANRAYTSKRVVSNALGFSEGGGMDNSSSMMMLNVHHYIAVPLLVQEKRRGVLYFDTRQALKKFERKHVKLLERVGGYIIDVERQ